MREAMFEIGRGAQYVAGQPAEMFKRGRNWQAGWASGARAALLALKASTGVEIPGTVTDYLTNADAANDARRSRKGA